MIKGTFKDFINRMIYETSKDIRENQTVLEEAQEAKRVAAEEGDLRENQAYHIADGKIDTTSRKLNQLGELKTRLNHLLNNTPKYSGYVSTGSKVELKIEKENGDTCIETRFLVPSSFSIAKEVLLDNTPIGVTIRGGKKGDLFNIITGNEKKITVTILSIE